MSSIVHTLPHVIAQKTNECAPAALAMVLEFFGIAADDAKIAASVSSDSPKWRDWIYAMGLYARAQGLQATVPSLATQTIDPSWKDLSMDALKEKLTDELAFATAAEKGEEPYPFYFAEHTLRLEIPELRAAIAFLDAGGIIRVTPTSAALLDQHIRSGGFVIAAVDATIFYGVARGIGFDAHDTHGTTWGHVVLLHGVDDNEFHIADPATWFAKSQQYTVPKDQLIESVLRRDQNVLLLSR